MTKIEIKASEYFQRILVTKNQAQEFRFSIRSEDVYFDFSWQTLVLFDFKLKVFAKIRVVVALKISEVNFKFS